MFPKVRIISFINSILQKLGVESVLGNRSKLSKVKFMHIFNLSLYYHKLATTTGKKFFCVIKTLITPLVTKNGLC